MLIHEEGDACMNCNTFGFETRMQRRSVIHQEEDTCMKCNTVGFETRLLALVTLNDRSGAGSSWGSLCVGRRASKLRVAERFEAQTSVPDPGEDVLRMCSGCSWVCSEVDGKWRRIPSEAVLYLTRGKGVLRRCSLSVRP